MKATWVVLAFLLAPFTVQAGDGKMHCHQAAAPGGNATSAYQAAMRTMHREMDIAYTGDADTDFAAGMIPHHQAAIEMANAELQYGKSRAMRRLARTIIFMQEQEVGYLRRWLEVRGVEHAVPDARSTAELKEVAAKMHQSVIEHTGNADVDFARSMIPHHQAAVDMAAVVVRHGRTPEITRLAQEIIRSQLAEIGLMRTWLEKRSKKTPSSHSPQHRRHHE